MGLSGDLLRSNFERVRDQSGQASLEYVTVLLVALALLGGGAAAANGSAIAGSVVAQFARAICIASAGDCEQDRAPCVVRSDATSDSAALVVSVVRLSGGRSLIRQRRSDGSEVITLTAAGGAGLELTAGARLSLGAAQFGAALVGSAGGGLTRGRSWVVRDRAAADLLISQLAAQPVPVTGRARRPRSPVPARRVPPPPADISFSERGLDSALAGRLAAAGVSFEAEDLVGERLNNHTGERRLTIRRRNELLGDVSPLPASGVEGGLRHTELYTLSVSRSGVMTDLGIFDARRWQAGVKLPDSVRSLIAGATRLPLRRGMLIEVEQHLDLAGAENRRIAAAFIAALRRRQIGFGPAAPVSRQIKERIASNGVTLVRSYELETRHSGFGGRAGAGVALGLEVDRTVESAYLRGARVRGLDGNWRTRDDCLAAR